MEIESQLQLIVMIETALAFADEHGQMEVGIYLDRARVAAGGSGAADQAVTIAISPPGARRRVAAR